MAELRDDPVIVLGMHHSGTSILTQVLHENGVFMHANMDHYESRFFTMVINDKLVMGGSGNWAAVPIMPVDEVLARVDAARSAIERRALTKYVEDGYDGESRWGFKDPRVCVLLPLYLQIFPNCQLLHIVRNEDDVAASLARSEKRGVGRNKDVDHWKELRRQYVARAREFGAMHRGYVELEYEDFCSRSVDVARTLFAYLRIPFSPTVEMYVHDHVRPLPEGQAISQAL
jgi:hypothetical protein